MQRGKVLWNSMVICLVVPSKTGGGWEVEPRAGGSVSFTELHRRFTPLAREAHETAITAQHHR